MSYGVRRLLTNILHPSLVLALVAWGVFAFGAVYPWAYVPLLAGSLVFGLAALFLYRGGRLSAHELPMLLAWLVLVGAVLVQLVPLPRAVLDFVSPGTPAFLEQYDLGYLAPAAAAGLEAPEAAAIPSGAGWHALSIRPRLTATGLAFLVTLGLLFFGLARAFSGAGLRRIVQGVIVLGSIVAFMGVAQLSILGDEAYTGMKIYGVWKPQSLLVTPFGPFVNRNHFAGWMLMALPLALGYLCSLVERSRVERPTTARDRILWFSTPEGGQFLLAGLAIVLMGFSLMMTRSRSGIVSFAVGMLFAGVLALRGFRSRGTRAWIALTLALLLAIPVLWLGFDAALGRFSTSGSALQLRFDAWRTALGIVADFPLAGTGLNTFGVATILYQTGGMELHLAQAHCDYLQVAAEGGVLLGLPALFLLVAIGSSAVRRMRSQDEDAEARWLRAGAAIGLVAIAVQSLVEFSLQMPGNAVLFVVLVAAAVHQPSRASSLLRQEETRAAYPIWIQ